MKLKLVGLGVLLLALSLYVDGSWQQWYYDREWFIPGNEIVVAAFMISGLLCFSLGITWNWVVYGFKPEKKT